MRTILSLLLAGSMPAASFGAYVVFDPGGETTLPSGTPSVSIDLTVVGETLAEMQGIDLFLYPPSLPYSWTYSDQTWESFTYLTPPSRWFRNGLEELVVGGNRLMGSVPSNLLLGTLTFDTTSLQSGDSFSLRVDPALNHGVSAVLNGMRSDRIGFAEVRVEFAPEPSTLVVLVLGATALLARRPAGARIRFQ